MSDRPTGPAPPRLTAVLGPTNTGKTHFAVERMLAQPTGMIGLPLRLLAREVYDRIVRARGVRSAALVTGEEKILPPRAQYVVCTVEAMPIGREVDFLAIDEIQLCADPERGHVFTDRLLRARGKRETFFLGASTMTPLIRRLAPDAEIVSRERLSRLTYHGPKKLTRLPRRSAVVAFSADQVYAIAELIRRQRGGAAVVMGSLSPRTRNAQVALFQSGEVDFLVATDAIGMGLNMDVDHVAFAGLRKFDGQRTRWLRPQEIAQIAGRAGRHRSDGTFGVTGDCEEMDADLVEAVETHAFDPVEAAEWRNSRLDFASLPALAASLAQAPGRPGLKLTAESLDETTLRRLADDETVQRRSRDRSNLMRLWEACQTPDFRKSAPDDHVRFVRSLFMGLTERDRRLPEDFLAGQFRSLDRLDGDIDALSARLAGVRTLAYLANRADWIADPAHWQGRTRALEDKLSDTLHERLMQRFIDRRTSALLRGLSVRGDSLLAGVSADGSVIVEGCRVGRIVGAVFEPVRGETALEDRTLRAATDRAVGPEVARRLGQLAQDADGAFRLAPDGGIYWRGALTGALAGGDPFRPRARLLGELGGELPRARALQRLEAFIAAEAGRRLAPLRALRAAIEAGALKGLARGIAWRLAEAGGVIDRREVEADLIALSQSERRALRALGVRFAAYSVHLPGLLNPTTRAFSSAFAAVAAPGWRPEPGRVSRLPDPPPTAATLALLGLRAVGALAAPVDRLEALDAALRAAPRMDGGVALPPDLQETVGCAQGDLEPLLRGLGFSPARKPADGAPRVWRRRRPRAADAASARPSPFAALAGLKPAPAPVRPHRPGKARRRRPPAHGRA